MPRLLPKKVDPPITSEALAGIATEIGISVIAPELGLPLLFKTFLEQALTPAGLNHTLGAVANLTTVAYNFLKIYQTWQDLGVAGTEAKQLEVIAKSLVWKDSNNNEHSLAELLGRLNKTVGGIEDEDRNANFNSLIQVLKKALLRVVLTPTHDNEEIGLIQTQILELESGHKILLSEAVARLLNDSEVRAALGEPFEY